METGTVNLKLKKYVVLIWDFMVLHLYTYKNTQNPWILICCTYIKKFRKTNFDSYIGATWCTYYSPWIKNLIFIANGTNYDNNLF